MNIRGANARRVRGQGRVALLRKAATLAAIAIAALTATARAPEAGAAPLAATGPIAGAAPSAAATEPSCADERSCVARVLELENERLALMPAVAAWKWRHRAPISDPARERVVIAESAKLAQSLGLDGPPIERLFALQIRLASDVEAAYHRLWQERGFDSSQPDLDLARDMRPRIDRLTQELLRALVVAAPTLSSPEFTARYAVDAQRQLQAPGWTPATRRELLAALAAVRRVPVATGAHSASGGAHSTRLILLGTNAGPVVSRFNSQPASLLIVDGRGYLIDAGSGTLRQLAMADYRPERLRTIFITHHHIDHDAGLPSLIAEIWFDKAWGHIDLPPTQIYGPPSTGFLVRTALDYVSVSERIFRAGVPSLAPAAPMFEARDIDHDGLVLDDGTVRVTAAENTHFHFKSSSPEAGADRSYSYRFDTPAGSVVFTGDTGPSEAVIRLASDADVLVSEVCAVCASSAPAAPAVPPQAGRSQLPSELAAQERFHMLNEHVTPEEVGAMAARARVKVLVLTHLAPNGPDTDTTIFTGPIAKHFAGTVIPGRDLLEYDLNSPAAGPRH